MTVTEQETSWPGTVATFIRRQKKTILLILVVTVMTLVLSATVSIILDNAYPISLPSIGNIKTLGVKAYWDQNLQNQTTGIQWGTVQLGQTYNVTFYLQSTSNVPVILEMTSTNWTYLEMNNMIAAGPTNSTSYMNISWNYNYQTLNPNEIIETTLALTTDNSTNFITFLVDNRIRQFTMDIMIQANER
jgi:hypothetical protein